MSLPAYVTAHKGDPNVAHFFLVKIECSPPQYLTDCDQALVYGGNTYVATRSLEVAAVGASAGARDIVSGSVKIGNADAAFGILVSGFVATAAMPAVTIYDAWLDVTASNLTVQAAYVALLGRATSPSWDSSWVSFNIAPYIDNESEKIPWRAYSTNCSYRVFKGPQCGYAGAGATCNRSYAQCSTYANTARFGGFRNIPAEDYEWVAGFQGSVRIKLTRRSV